MFLPLPPTHSYISNYICKIYRRKNIRYNKPPRVVYHVQTNYTSIEIKLKTTFTSKLIPGKEQQDQHYTPTDELTNSLLIRSHMLFPPYKYA